MLFLIFCLACSVFSALQSCRGSSQDGEGRIRPGASAESSRARAALLLRQGDPRGALNLLEPAASDSDPDTSLLLGEAALRCGRYALAGKAFRRVLRARPEDVFATMDPQPYLWVTLWRLGHLCREPCLPKGSREFP